MRTIPELDRIIGWNIRHLREMKRLRQWELAAPLLISYQQIQKFERGENSISASQLFIISVTLGCSMEAFYRRDPEDIESHQAQE